MRVVREDSSSWGGLEALSLSPSWLASMSGKDAEDVEGQSDCSSTASNTTPTSEAALLLTLQA